MAPTDQPDLTFPSCPSLQTSAQQGAITYPLVEILVPSHEMCNLCAKCGAFETQQEESTERFKRCARCKQVFYVSKRAYFC